MTALQQSIIEDAVLSRGPGPLSSRILSKETGIDFWIIITALQKMREDGLIDLTEHGYELNQNFYEKRHGP